MDALLVFSIFLSAKWEWERNGRVFEARGPAPFANFVQKCTRRCAAAAAVQCNLRPSTNLQRPFCTTTMATPMCLAWTDYGSSSSVLKLSLSRTPPTCNFVSPDTVGQFANLGCRYQFFLYFFTNLISAQKCSKYHFQFQIPGGRKFPYVGFEPGTSHLLHTSFRQEFSKKSLNVAKCEKTRESLFTF